MSLTASELGRRIGARVRGDPTVVLERCAALEEADGTSVSFLAKRKYRRFLTTTRAGAVIASEEAAQRSSHPCLLVCENPRRAFRQAVLALHGERKHRAVGISDLAVISPRATLGESCSIHPLVVIDHGARLGDRCVVYPHCYIGPDTNVGNDCVLFAGVTIYERCVLGNGVVIHAGSVIGEDGFGYVTEDGEHLKIPHTGTVVIEDEVEIGSCCTIDRGTLRATVIGRGTKMSNSVAIGHGTRVGRYNLIVGQVGIAGSAETGDYVTIGGQSGIADHVKVGDRVQIAAKSGVLTNIPAGGKYAWLVAIPYEDAIKVGWEVIQLPKLVREFQQVKRRLAELEEQTLSRQKEKAGTLTVESPREVARVAPGPASKPLAPQTERSR